MEDHPPVIRTRHLTKRYGRKIAVDHLDLLVKRGQVYALLGENGAGKTTTLRLLLGLQHPDEGEVELFGLSLRQHRLEILRRVGSLIEFPSFYGHLTGRENLEVIRRLRDLSCTEVERVLGIMRLQEAAHLRVAHYSQGMKQRLAMAMALMGIPAAWPALALHVWLGVRFRNFLVTTGVALAGEFLELLSFNHKIGRYFPWSFPIATLGANRQQGIDWPYLAVAVLLGLAIGLAGMWDFRRQELT